MDILLSIIGSAVLTVLLSIAYTAGVCAGKAATHMEEDDELKIYMDHTHGEDEQQQQIKIVVQLLEGPLFCQNATAYFQ